MPSPQIALAFALLATPAAAQTTHRPLKPAPAAPAAEDGPYQDCVARGIAWFRQMGSYPYLQGYPNRGRPAVDVAAERCRRGNNSFQ